MFGMVALLVVLMFGFLLLAVWAFVVKKGSPLHFVQVLDGVHILFLVTLVLSLLTHGGKGGITKVIEYLVVFVGGGVLYTRFMLPGGFLHRALTNSPSDANISRSMMLGNLWNFAAALGYIFFSVGGK